MTCHKLVPLSECLELLTLFSVLPSLRMFLQYISAEGDSKSGVKAPQMIEPLPLSLLEQPDMPLTHPPPPPKRDVLQQ